MAPKTVKRLQERAGDTPSKSLMRLPAVEAGLLAGVLLAAGVLAADRCRANMAHVRPDHGLGFQVQVFNGFYD